MPLCSRSTLSEAPVKINFIFTSCTMIMIIILFNIKVFSAKHSEFSLKGSAFVCTSPVDKGKGAVQ